MKIVKQNPSTIFGWLRQWAMRHEGDLIRRTCACARRDKFNIVLTRVSLLYRFIISPDISSDGRVSGCLERQTKCNQAYNDPHRRADINWHHREARVRPNQRSNKRTEAKVGGSLASTQATMRTWERFGRDGVHDGVHEVRKQTAQTVEGKIHGTSVGSSIPEEEGACDDGGYTHRPPAAKSSSYEKAC